jgi:hypothetical protein
VSGQTVTVNVDASGLGAMASPTIGAFDLTMSFPSSLLASTAVSFGPTLGDPSTAEALTETFLSPDSVEFAEVSLLAPSALDALHESTSTLASLSFQALSSGTGSFALTTGVVDDPFGTKLAQIPEPSEAILLGWGLLLMLAGLATRRMPRARGTSFSE